MGEKRIDQLAKTLTTLSASDRFVVQDISDNETAQIGVEHVRAEMQAGTVPESRTISTDAPLSGGGALSGDLTLNISPATSGAAGSMSAADKAKLDGIEAGADVTDASNVAAAGAVMTTRTVSTTAPLTGGGALSSNLTLGISDATTSAKGAMSAADKAKLDGIEANADVTDAANVATAGAVMTSRTISTTAPLAGGGALSGNLTLSVATATPGAAGVSPPGTPITETGTTRTLSDSDHGREILCTHASGCAVTVPDTVTPGLKVLLRALGGQVTVAGSGTMTIVTPDDQSAASFGEGSPVFVSVESSTVCRVSGDLVNTGTPSVLESRTISTTAPLTGGGDLSANRTLGISAATTGTAGSMSAADKLKLDGIEAGADVTDAANVAAAGAVMNTLVLTAGNGLTGGGSLAANRAFHVAPHADGSIVVAPDAVQVGVLATDAQHGVRGGGTQHALVVAAGAAGFMSGADKTKLDGIAAGAVADHGALTGLNDDDHALYLRVNGAREMTGPLSVGTANWGADWYRGSRQETFYAQVAAVPVDAWQLDLSLLGIGGVGYIVGEIVGINKNSSGKSLCYRVLVHFRRIGGVMTIVDNEVTATANSSGVGDGPPAFAVSSGKIVLTVYGTSGEDFRWSGHLRWQVATT